MPYLKHTNLRKPIRLKVGFGNHPPRSSIQSAPISLPRGPVPLSQGLLPGPGVPLPASNFPQTRPAPSQARSSRRPLPLPLPAAPHVLGARVAARPTHRISARHSRVSSRGPVGSKLKRPWQGRQASGRMRSAAAGPCSPLTRPLRPRPVHRHRPSESRPAFAQPLGRRPGTAPRPPSTRPAPVLPAAPFLTGGLGGAEGADSGRRPPPRPGSPPPSPRAPGVSGYDSRKTREVESKWCQQDRTEEAAAWMVKGSPVLSRRILEKLWGESIQNKTTTKKSQDFEARFPGGPKARSSLISGIGRNVCECPPGVKGGEVPGSWGGFFHAVLVIVSEWPQELTI
ncbi:uncharacterized protein LOC141585071 [Saimiri boliviensis]|uniref:uncharacterized protein LOC141585071 n=1 Tax=Saimiri boliviensis TaxID=27679 RepID=UPI003D786EDE